MLSSTQHQGFTFIKVDGLPTDTDKDSILFYCVSVVFNVLASSECFKLRQSAFPDEHVHYHVEKQSIFFAPKPFYNYSVHFICGR